MSDNMELLEKAIDIMERQAQVMTSMHERNQALTETNTQLTEALNAVTAKLESMNKAYQMDACGLDVDDDEEDAPKLAALLSEPTVFDDSLARWRSRRMSPRYKIDDTDEAWIRIEDLLDGDETDSDFEFFAVAAFAKREDAEEWLENHQEWLDSDPTIV